MILFLKHQTIAILLIQYFTLFLIARDSEAVINNLKGKYLASVRGNDVGDGLQAASPKYHLNPLVTSYETHRKIRDEDYDLMPPLYGLDDYHKCLRDNEGQYCLAFFYLYSTKPNKLMTMIQEYSSDTLKHFNHSYIQRGICVTKTCEKYSDPNKGDLNLILGACLNDSIYQEYGIFANLSMIAYCDKSNEIKEIEMIDWAVAILFGLIFILNLVGSLKENKSYRPDESSKTVVNGNFWTHFDIQRNWKSLINTQSQETDFPVLHFIRSISLFLVIFGHSMWLIYFGYIDNTHNFEKGYDSILYMIIFNGMMVVQIFFVMSGFLLMYYCLKFSEKNVMTWNMYPRFLLLRWSRLIPASALSLAFSATWLRFLGSGPLWNMFITGGVVADCRRYWWLHLLYLNNYTSEDKFCELHTWHLAADFQLYGIGLMAYIATSSGRRRSVVLLSLLLLGMLAAAVQVFTRDLGALVLLTPEFHRKFASEEFHGLHVLGHINLPSYVVGMAAGITTYNLLRKQKLPSRCLLWVISVPGWCWMVFCAVLLLSPAVCYNIVPPLLVRAVYAGTHRAALGAVIAVIILAPLLRNKVPLKGLLEWRGWVVSSRLTYCIYVVHVNLILVLISIKTQLDQANLYRVIIFYFGIVSASTLLALPLHLLVEVPFRRLINSYIGSHNNKLHKN